MITLKEKTCRMAYYALTALCVLCIIVQCIWANIFDIVEVFVFLVIISSNIIAIYASYLREKLTESKKIEENAGGV